MAFAPLSTASFFGQSRAITGHTPGCSLSQFIKSAQPAKYSCAIGLLLGPLARRMILASFGSGEACSSGTPDWSCGSAARAERERAASDAATNMSLKEDFTPE